MLDVFTFRESAFNSIREFPCNIIHPLLFGTNSLHIWDVLFMSLQIMPLLLGLVLYLHSFSRLHKARCIKYVFLDSVARRIHLTSSPDPFIKQRPEQRNVRPV